MMTDSERYIRKTTQGRKEEIKEARRKFIANVERTGGNLSGKKYH
jgi:hypothetical protein